MSVFWLFYVPFLWATRRAQHGPQEQLTGKSRPCDVEIGIFFPFFFKQFWSKSFSPLSVWGRLRRFRCVQTNNHTSPNHEKEEEKNLHSDDDRGIDSHQSRQVMAEHTTATAVVEP